MNNMEYMKDGIRVWRVYNVGKGKFIFWSEFNILSIYVCLMFNIVVNCMFYILFNVVKVR